MKLYKNLNKIHNKIRMMNQIMIEVYNQIIIHKKLIIKIVIKNKFK